MRSRLDSINPQIEQLMLTKSYAQLTVAESLLLEDKFSPARYDATRKTLLAATDMFARDLPLPSSKVKTNLLKVLAAQKEKSTNSNWWSTLLNYPVPAWQPALGVSLIVLYFFVPWTGTQNLSEQNVLALQETDTAYEKARFGYLAASVPVSTVPIRRKNVGPISSDLTQKHTILDTLQEVAQTIQRTFSPATDPRFVPAMQLSNSTFAANDTAGVRPQTMEQYWIDPVHIMAVQDQSRRLVSF